MNKYDAYFVTESHRVRDFGEQIVMQKVAPTLEELVENLTEVDAELEITSTIRIFNRTNSKAVDVCIYADRNIQGSLDFIRHEIE